MPYHFHSLTLHASSFYPLIATPIEFRLRVTDTTAEIFGYGFPFPESGAITTLILNWEATIYLDRATLDLPSGEYDLAFVAETLHAFRDGTRFVVPDGAVRMEVVSVPEEEE